MVKLTYYKKLFPREKPAMALKSALNFSHFISYEEFVEKGDKVNITEGKTVEYCI
jgi:hypothetical protein